MISPPRAINIHNTKRWLEQGALLDCLRNRYAKRERSHYAIVLWIVQWRNLLQPPSKNSQPSYFVSFLPSYLKKNMITPNVTPSSRELTGLFFFVYSVLFFFFLSFGNHPLAHLPILPFLFSFPSLPACARCELFLTSRVWFFVIVRVICSFMYCVVLLSEQCLACNRIHTTHCTTCIC